MANNYFYKVSNIPCYHKATLRHHLTPLRVAIEERETLKTQGWWEYKLVRHHGNWHGVFSNNSKENYDLTQLHCFPAFPRDSTSHRRYTCTSFPAFHIVSCLCFITIMTIICCGNVLLWVCQFSIINAQCVCMLFPFSRFALLSAMISSNRLSIFSFHHTSLYAVDS